MCSEERSPPAWFFFLVNVFKVPFHVFVWKTITVESAALLIR